MFERTVKIPSIFVLLKGFRQISEADVYIRYLYRPLLLQSGKCLTGQDALRIFMQAYMALHMQLLQAEGGVISTGIPKRELLRIFLGDQAMADELNRRIDAVIITEYDQAAE